MVKQEIQLYKFGAFQLDTVKRVLLHDNSPVQLPSRAFDVLLALVEHNQCVIDKDELMQLVWGERVVEENNLTRHISTLRKALEESPNDHRYIVTVPGRGYSFVAAVETVISRNAQGIHEKQNADSVNPDVVPEDELGIHHFDRLTTVDSPQEQKIAKIQPRITRRIWITVLVIVLILSIVVSFKVIKPPANGEAINSYRDWDVVRLTRD